MTRHTDPPLAACDPDEALLQRLFAQLTGRSSITADCDFLALGGDSLAAMILVTELRQAGRDLSLEMLQLYRTPRAIAAAWKAAATRRRDEPEAPRGTLFVIPGVGGDIPALARLRADLSARFDCVLLDYPDWADFAKRGYGMERLLDDFQQRLRQHHFAGPLRLAGFSLGALVAWPLAERLARSGRPVDALFILDMDTYENQPAASRKDPGEPPISAPRRRPFGKLIHRGRALRASFASEDRSLTSRAVGEIIAYRVVDRPGALRLLSRLRFLRLPASVRTWTRWLIGNELQSRLIGAWNRAEGSLPRDFAIGRTVLFRAAHNPGASDDLGWRRRCATLEIEAVAGDHLTMLDERGVGSLFGKLSSMVGD